MKTPAQTPDELVAVAKRLAERVAELEEKLEQREAELHATDLARLENLSTVTAAEIISEAFLDGDVLGILEATS
jgi:transposase